MTTWKPRSLAHRALMLGGACCGGKAALAAPGDHIRAGEMVITPSVATGFEYHSNAFLLEGGESTPPVPGAAWTFTPRFASELEGNAVELYFGAGWSLKKFIDFVPDDVYNVQKLDRFTDFDAMLGLNALTRNLIGFRLDDRFEVQSNPAELQTSTTSDSANYVHTSNDLNAGATVRPGSAMEIGILGNLGIDRYTVPPELADDGDPNINNRTNYGPVVDVKWRFLPKTSLLGSASMNFLRWEKNLVNPIGSETEGQDVGSLIGKPDATAWRTSWGIRGQFTDKIAASVELGYGQMYYDETSVTEDPAAAQLDPTGIELTPLTAETYATDLTSFGEGVTVNAQVAWAPVRGQTFTLGYRKDFQDAFFSNYQTYNYGFVRYEGLFASKFGLTGEFTYRIDQFHGVVARGDRGLRLKLKGAYRFTDYLAAEVGGGWVERGCIDETCGAGGEFFSTQYDDFSVTAGATFTY